MGQSRPYESRTGRAPQQGPMPIEAEIRDELRTWIEAINSGDVDTVCALYAPDAVLLPTFSQGPLTTPDERKNYFVNFKARKELYAKIDECRIAAVGEDGAVASGLYTFVYIDNGAARTVKARFTFAFTHQPDGGWLIIAHHSSQAPAP